MAAAAGHNIIPGKFASSQRDEFIRLIENGHRDREGTMGEPASDVIPRSQFVIRQRGRGNKAEGEDEGGCILPSDGPLF